MKKLPWIVLASVAIACATNPATGRRQLTLLTEADEIALGRQADSEVRQEMGVYDSAALQAYVDRLGQSLARGSHRPKLPWSFAVVDESAVNAFALPGGFIFVTRGILPYMRNEAELAAVLGHEVGHVDGRHSVDQYSRQMLTNAALAGGSAFLPKWAIAFSGLGVAADFLFLRYGRNAELEADRLGVGYIASNGWEPDAIRGILGTLGRIDEFGGSKRGVPNWALSHPPAADRITRLNETIAAIAGNPNRTNTQEFESLIEGIVVGDSPEDGMVRGSEFVHPVMRFSLTFPEGWRIANSSTRVTAQAPEPADAGIVLSLSKHAGQSAEEASRLDMASSGLKLTRGGAVRINGLDAYDATYEGLIETTPASARVAHIKSGQQMYMVAGLATTAEFGKVDPAFAAVVRSFRTLSASEAEQIRPNRLRFHTVQSGDTWESLARRATRYGAPTATSLAIMNGSDPKTPPKPGSRVRVVVGG